MSRSLLAVATVICASFAPSAMAAAKLETASGVDRPIVGVGDTFVYTIAISTSSGSLTISSPLPGKIDGFDLLGQHSAPTIEGTRAVISTRFTLRAKKIGSFLLGPGRVTTESGDVTMPLARVQVVAAGTAPPPKPAPKTKKKGIWGDPYADFSDDDFFPAPPPPPPPSQQPIDPLARVDALPIAAGDRYTFVRVGVDDVRPVVGAPITAKLYVYTLLGRPSVEVRKPPMVSEFRIAQMSTKGETWKPITIEGRGWSYGLANNWTLYPLRAGKLEISGAQAVLVNDDPFTGKSTEEPHDAPLVVIDSVEPPIEGRPPGYVIGDVAGDLWLSAEIAPRVIKDGHAVVQVKMKGIGRIDALRPILATPPGVSWTATDDDVRTVTHQATIEGQRRMGFDARFDRFGDIDLGDVTVSVWDHQKKAYFTARANLGHVQVDNKAESDAKVAQLPALPGAREAIGRIGGGKTIVDSKITWAIAFGAPALVVIAQLLSAATKKRKAEREGREATPADQARVALEQARKGDDVLASLTRALDRAVESSAGVRPRGLTRSQLASALADHPKRAAIVAAFADLESARFAGGSSPPVAEVARLVEELLA